MRHESHTCDRCLEVFIKSDEFEYVIVTSKEIEDLKALDENKSSVAYIVFKYTHSGLDLCSRCNLELKQWIELEPKRLTQ